MISSVFEIDLGEHADVVYRSLCPELEDVPSLRSGVTLELKGSTIKLSIEAKDIVSLRAALNTWLRLIKIAHEMAKM
ncbi:MAG: KEOPS complex subunit Pcc1 [Methanocellales archaeon]|nr:KEOPS complex subunit Pcc1 [Methanocellales archaeon]